MTFMLIKCLDDLSRVLRLGSFRVGEAGNYCTTHASSREVPYPHVFDCHHIMRPQDKTVEERIPSREHVPKSAASIHSLIFDSLIC
jgi:hypothetical protein